MGFNLRELQQTSDGRVVSTARMEAAARPTCRVPQAQQEFVFPQSRVESPDPPSFWRETFGCRKSHLFSAEGSFLTYVCTGFLRDSEV